MQNEFCNSDVQRGSWGLPGQLHLAFPPFLVSLLLTLPTPEMATDPKYSFPLHFQACRSPGLPFLSSFLEESTNSEMLEPSRGVTAESSTSTLSLPAWPKLQGFLSKLNYFICCSLHPSKLLQGVKDRKAAARCQISPQTLFFLSDKMHFFLLHFRLWQAH